MKKKMIAGCLLVASLMLAACGNLKEDTSAAGNENEVADQSAAADEDVAETDGKAAETGESIGTDEGIDTGEETGDAETAGTDTQRRALTEEELQFFTEFAQKRDNYGFFMSEYETAKDVNLDDVFYSGAGIAESVTNEDIEAYLSATGESEMYTDCVKIYKSKADELLQRKTGYSIEDMTKQLDWVYVQETDAYMQQVGDTNYMRYDCSGGTVEGNVYTLQMFPDSDFHPSCETVLKKNGEEYQFVSNKFLND
ncbi:MAG: hypothetical protein IJ711_02690 [Lachnospiraceae bacterium]|nr:hypothetical protein [Lachnospiraceae bacterium]